MVRDWEKIGQPARMGVSRSRDTCRCFKFHQTRVYSRAKISITRTMPASNYQRERRRMNPISCKDRTIIIVPCQSVVHILKLQINCIDKFCNDVLVACLLNRRMTLSKNSHAICTNNSNCVIVELINHYRINNPS